MFSRKLSYPRICILPIPIHVSVSVLLRAKRRGIKEVCAKEQERERGTWKMWGKEESRKSLCFLFGFKF